MGTMAIPFTEEMRGVILREARRRNMAPETLLKVWVLERAREEIGAAPKVATSQNPEHIADPVDLLALPLKFGLALIASATVTVNTLVEEISRQDARKCW